MEIEIKVGVNDISKLKEKLNSIGAKFLERRKEIDEYFSLKNRDFWETLECLRIRRLPKLNKSILTYKPPTTEEMKKKKIFYKEELETPVNGEVMKQILLALGCISLITVEKEREYWQLGGKKITIDKVKDLGNFMEIELNSQNDRIEEKKREMVRVLENLGFSLDDVINQPYRCMLRKVKKQ